MDADLTDADALVRSVDDPRWFAIVYRRHLLTVARYLTRRVGSEASEDLTAELFLRAFRRRADYQPRYATALPWLMGIAGKLISEHRRDERRRLYALARLTSVPSACGYAPDGGLAPELIAAVRKLSRSDRDTLLLSFGGSCPMRRRRLRWGSRSEPCALGSRGPDAGSPKRSTRRPPLATPVEREEHMREADRSLELLRALGEIDAVPPALDVLEDRIAKALAAEGRRRSRRWSPRSSVIAIVLSAAVTIAVAAVALTVLSHRSSSSTPAAPRPTFHQPPLHPSAAKRRALARDLGSFQATRYCISPASYAHRAQQILDDHGWTGWSVMVEGAGALDALGSGHCAQIPPGDGGQPDIRIGSLFNLHTHTLILNQAQPPAVDRARGQMLPTLIAASGQRCYSYSSVKSAVSRLVAGDRVTERLTLAFARTQTPLGIQYGDGRQERYQQGCAVILDMGMAAGSLTQLGIWIAQSTAPPLPHGLSEPRPSSYRPATRQ